MASYNLQLKLQFNHFQFLYGRSQQKFHQYMRKYLTYLIKYILYEIDIVAIQCFLYIFLYNSL